MLWSISSFHLHVKVILNAQATVVLVKKHTKENNPICRLFGSVCQLFASLFFFFFFFSCKKKLSDIV